MTGTWIERPIPPHQCRKPNPERTSVVLLTQNDWQCTCGKVYRWTERFDQREGDYSGWEKVRDA